MFGAPFQLCVKCGRCYVAGRWCGRVDRTRYSRRMDTMKPKVAEPKPHKLPVVTAIEEPKRCTGHCCKRFYLPLSPDQIKQARAEGRYTDIETIADMVIYLEYSNVSVTGETRDEFGHYYTCKHFDAATNNCGIYERRPAMCYEYPYGKPCLYKECTMRGNCGVVDRGITYPRDERSAALDQAIAEAGAKLKELVECDPSNGPVTGDCVAEESGS